MVRNSSDPKIAIEYEKIKKFEEEKRAKLEKDMEKIKIDLSELEEFRKEQEEIKKKREEERRKKMEKLREIEESIENLVHENTFEKMVASDKKFFSIAFKRMD